MQLVRLILPIALLAAAGSAQDVRYNFDKTAVFEKFRTYKWVDIKGAPRLNSLVDQQVKNAFEAELARKGLVKSMDGNADLWIGYQVSLSQEKEFSSYSSDFGYGPSWGRGWYGGAGSSITTGQTSTIHIGELALDMYDPTAKQIVWRGTAAKTIDPKAKPDKRQKNLAKGVAKLLKNYPPPPAKG